MAGNYLKLNRHGTLYYFRRRIPDDLRLTLGRTQLIKSLGTGRRAEAIALARMLTAHTDKIFHRLRGMTENQKDTIRTDFTDCWEAEFEINGVKHKVRSQITDIKPGEEEAASRYANQTRTQALADAIAAGVNASNVLLSPALAMPDNRGELASGKTIMEVFEEFKEFQIAIGAQADVKGGWKNPGRVDVEQTQHIRAFVEFIGGDRPICEVCTEDVVGFKKFVMTTDTIGSAQSRKIRLNRTAAVFKYAKEELKYIKYGFTEEFKYKGKPKKNPYLKFTVSDLKALFESDAYRDHEHGSSSQYWLPLLGLYTGARINELCQLLCSDITEKDGV